MEGHLVNIPSVSPLRDDLGSEQDNSPGPSQARCFGRDVTDETDHRIPYDRRAPSPELLVDTPVPQQNRTCTVLQRQLSPILPAPIAPALRLWAEREKYRAIAKAVIGKNDPKYLDDISEQSWVNMAQGLQFAGVDTNELADTMNLRVCPPSTVINTWAALHGTTIFDGANNPKGYEHLNYVRSIGQHATRLADWGLPLLIVFSNRNLTPEQIEKMHGDFASHNNVLCICMESELGLDNVSELNKLVLSRKLKSGLTGTLNFYYIDAMRIVLCNWIDKLLGYAQEKALSEGKEAMYERLKRAGRESIFYCDMDDPLAAKAAPSSGQ